MYILRNAAKNLLRNKGRNILIGIILLAMLSATAISMIINTTSEKIIEDYKTRFGAEVFINVDIDKLMSQNSGEMGDLPEVTYEQKKSFSQSDYLKETLFTGSYAAYNDQLTGVGQEETQSDENTQSENSYSLSSTDEYYRSNLTLLGYSDTKQLTEFSEGARKITSGELFKSDNECIVSEEFAKLNKLSVGDSINVKDCDKNTDKIILTLKITGIYYDTTQATVNGIPASIAINRRNEILTNMNTLISCREVLKQEGLTPEFVNIESTYILKNPDLLDKFDAEVRTKGLSDMFAVTTDASTYNQIVKPVEGVAQTSTIFLILVLVIGSLVLVVLSTLTIRERKYEIGVLRAMGMKKSAVARGLIYETLLTISACLVIGLAIGSISAQPVSNIMLQNQIEASNAANSLQTNYGVAIDTIDGGGNTNNEETLTEMKVSLMPKAVLQIAAIALLLGVLSSAAGLLYILRYEPMKILSERN